MNKVETRHFVFSNPVGFFAFGFGSGLAPVGPGTAGTLAALPMGIALSLLPLWAGLAIVSAAFVIGIYLCGQASLRLGVHDHPGIVWDEFVGLWLVMIFVPFHWVWWLAAFVAFRFFDILKPWPIRRLDREVTGGLGIMLDDVLAAVYALAVLTFAAHVIT